MDLKKNVMKAEINNENKARFFAQYLGQKIALYKIGDSKFGESSPIKVLYYQFNSLIDEGYNFCVELKPLSSISDEDAIEVAKLVFQRDSEFKVVRRYENPFGVHVEWENEKIRETHHISINKYGNINANNHFAEQGRDKPDSFKQNIGENDLTSKKPVPYIAIVDYLRSKGYAMPWMGLSVEEMVEAGWVKLV